MWRWHVRCLLVGMTSNDRIVALTVAQERISPVFDVAQTALIIEQAKSGELRRTLLDLSGLTLEDRLARLKNRGVNELVCGAMSKPALALAIEAFSEVHAFVAGDLETVIASWRDGRLDSPVFGMPGCGRPRRCCGRTRRCCERPGEQEG